MSLSLIIHDIRKGLYRNWVKFLLFFLYMLLISVGFCYDTYYVLKINTGLIGLFSCKLFAGIPIYNYSEMDALGEISLPAVWLLMILFFVYVLGDYIYEEMQGLGMYKLLLVGRDKWWVSKIIYIIIEVVFYLIILVGVPFVTSLFFYRGRIIGPSMDTLIFYSGFGDFYAKTSVFYTHLILIPILCFLAIAIWYAVLSVVITPTRAFIVMTIYLTIGIYHFSPFFIGNQLMLVRCEELNPNGLNPVTSIWIDVVLIVFGVLIGRSIIKKKDFIN